MISSKGACKPRFIYSYEHKYINETKSDWKQKCLFCFPSRNEDLNLLEEHKDYFLSHRGIFWPNIKNPNMYKSKTVLFKYCAKIILISFTGNTQYME